MSVIDALRNATTADIDLADDVHKHFSRRKNELWHWCDVADEAGRLWNEAFPDEPTQYGEPARSLIGGAAAASYYGAIQAVAAALGVSPEGLHLAVSPYTEAKPGERPAPMSPQEFAEEVAHWAEWRVTLTKTAQSAGNGATKINGDAA